MNNNIPLWMFWMPVGFWFIWTMGQKHGRNALLAEIATESAKEAERIRALAEEGKVPFLRRV